MNASAEMPIQFYESEMKNLLKMKEFDILIMKTLRL